MQLGEVAHSRSGDKGNISQISVIAYKAADFELIERAVTAERVKQHLGLPAAVVVERYVVPGLSALNFVLNGALGGGVTRSIRLDAHGKTLAMQLLDLELTTATADDAA